jgi:hypothetical protein
MTNFADHGRVNRRADRLFFGGGRSLTQGALHAAGVSFAIEKSIRGVYDALALDFDEIQGD